MARCKIRERLTEHAAHAEARKPAADKAEKADKPKRASKVSARATAEGRSAGCQKLSRSSWQALATSMLSSTLSSAQSCGI